MLASALYQGKLRHRRFEPRAHQFSYDLFMAYLDLQELDQVFAQSHLWSQERFNIAQFKRSDYGPSTNARPNPKGSLYETIANLVEQKHQRPYKIRMLSNLRYWGFIINPITCYYCFDEQEQLDVILLEVTNTPWKQRCHYLLDINNDTEKKGITFQKMMHVSPFQPMDLDYRWQGNEPNEQLNIHFDVKDREKTVFDATLLLKRQAINGRAMNKVLLKHPWMTMKVFGAIYWQAAKLAIKRTPFYKNPQ